MQRGSLHFLPFPAYTGLYVVQKGVAAMKEYADLDDWIYEGADTGPSQR